MCVDLKIKIYYGSAICQCAKLLLLHILLPKYILHLIIIFNQNTWQNGRSTSS